MSKVIYIVASILIHRQTIDRLCKNKQNIRFLTAMAFSLSQRVVETMPSGTWNDFTDLPAEFISQFGSSSEAMQYSCYYSDSFIRFATAVCHNCFFPF